MTLQLRQVWRRFGGRILSNTLVQMCYTEFYKK